jgi:hypothetical protein
MQHGAYFGEVCPNDSSSIFNYDKYYSLFGLHYNYACYVLASKKNEKSYGSFDYMYLCFSDATIAVFQWNFNYEICRDYAILAGKSLEKRK